MSKVLFINGSPNEHGCTATAMEETIRVLKENGIETETLWLGKKPMADCVACGTCQTTGKCVFDDEVNAVVGRIDEFDGIVVGEIKEVLPHPNADKLRVCRVDIGEGEIKDIVCGGSNLEVGMKVVVACPGAMVRWHGEGDPVEIKNANFGEKTSLSHLTYVGDSDVGEKVNFGCGTVTCNYDGKKKFRTKIGSKVFIGCQTKFIPPVSVGDRAYIAAGTTVTDDVPEDSFVIGRSRQTVKTDWQDKRKK